MRGSPLLRTLVVLAVLLLAGLGLARLTAPSTPKPVVEDQKPSPAAEASTATFELLLSATAKSVSLEAGGPAVAQESPASTLTGNLEVVGEQPVIFLKVEWADTTPGHRFAKLRIDRSGKETLEHVFSAPGDIDDLWEP
jgi:hypothetical protein